MNGIWLQHSFNISYIIHEREDQMTDVLSRLHQHIENSFLQTKTGQYYDYLTDEGLEALPYPDEIAAGFPNPCGWGTGMEDAMLHAGSMLDVYARRGDAAKVTQILAGVQCSVTVHGVPGFVARAVSPRDGKSCYANSSRDQFTLAVFGVWRCFQRGMEVATARELLRMIAAYCRQRMTPENGNLLRLDGLPGLVSDMRHVASHEALRLPMFYASAAAAGSLEFRPLAEELFEAALRQTLEMDPAHHWWDVELVQQQLSLVVLQECALFSAHDLTIRQAMQQTADYAVERLRAVVAEAESFAGDWYAANRNWRSLPLRIEDCCRSQDKGCVPYGGKWYLNPIYPEAYMRVFSLLRGMGNYLITLAYAPSCTDLPALAGRVYALLRNLDCSRLKTGAMIQLLHGLSLADRRTTID